MRFLCFLIIAILVICCKPKDEMSVASTEQKLESVEDAFKIEIYDDEALDVIDADASIKVLAEGFAWTEGPLWIDDDGGYLLFSEIPSNTVYKLDEKGGVSEYLSPSGYSGEGTYSNEPGSNGLLLNTAGELVLMQHGDRKVAKMNAPISAPHEDYVTLAHKYKGKKLNSPNDACFDREGHLYFTDPPYGLPEGMSSPSKELDYQGVYFLSNDGALQLLDSLTRPNGVALSPDQSVLYVAVSDPKQAVWYQYDVIEPGQVANKQIFHDVTSLIGKPGQKGLPDGLKVHTSGLIFATGPGGVWIFNSSGVAIAKIITGQSTSNCAFDTKEKKLYMTADDYVLAVDLK